MELVVIIALILTFIGTKWLDNQPTNAFLDESDAPPSQR